jgi:hypothetical protein
VRERGAFEVGVDLFDDRVPAVGFVRSDGVEDAGSVVVKKAWKRLTSNRVPCPAAAFLAALKSGIPAHDQPARDLVCLLPGERRIPLSTRTYRNTMTTTATAVPSIPKCPDWCDRPAGHDFDFGAV